jgi:polysaccharide export outer membrane protein
VNGALRRVRHAACILLCLVCVNRAQTQTEDADSYIVGSQDVIRINVWNQEDVSGQYTVERDGTFTFPLLGRVNTRGLTLRALEAELTRLLADGFFKNPQVTVAVVEYRSQRVFAVGEVRTPGTYPLTGDMTLIEALARAGSTTADAADHVLILRSAGARGPVLPDDANGAEIIRIDLRSIENGQSQKVLLRDGDTVFVPRAVTVFVTGHERTPGAYPITDGTTVLQALSLAGGVTDYGATNRIKVLRIVNGQERSIKVKLNDLVQPGDTIVVPARYF